jgi:hypothetical protein
MEEGFKAITQWYCGDREAAQRGAIAARLGMATK